MKVAVVGAGPLGQALAVLLKEAGQQVLLGYRKESVHGVPVSGDAAELAGFAELVVMAVPGWELEQAVRNLPLGPGHRVVVAGPGPEPVNGAWLHELVSRCSPALRVGVLAGTTHASEILSGGPCAAVVGSRFREVCDLMQAALHSPRCRVYTSEDPRGVQLASTFAGVVAVAVGVADGVQLGAGARALVISRGLAEATRLGGALGASPETFTGLAGLGDLLVSTTGEGHPAYQVGRQLAADRDVSQDDLFRQAGVALRLAAKAKVDLPLTRALVATAHRKIKAQEAFKLLMSRAARQGGEV